MHDVLTIGIPLVAIFFGILLSQKGLDRLDGRMDKLESRFDLRFNAVDGRLGRMQSDLYLL